MDPDWTPICLIPHEDVPRFGEQAPKGYKLVSFVTAKNKFSFADCAKGEEELDADMVFRDAVARCHSTARGQAEQVRLAKIWMDRFGAAPPPLIDLGGTTDLAGLSPRLLPLFVQFWRESEARSTELMRELALLRGSFDQSQTGFSRLETFLYNSGGAERAQTMSLSALSGRAPVVLTKGRPVEQRLPIESSGLSDVAFLLAEVPSASGTLTAKLSLMESGQVMAEWAVPAENLSKGWVRLSLFRALGPDAQTPVLHLEWTGSEPLKLAASFRHPDTRFCATGSNAVLALNLWTYIAAAAAPLPADGVVQLASAQNLRWTIGPDALCNAVDLNSTKDLVEFTSWRGSLAVRPVSQTISCVRIDHVGRPGLVHLQGGVKTEAVLGPDVEYRYGLAPQHKRSKQRGALPSFSEGMTSEWLRLPANDWAVLHWFLAQPLQEVCDLYLMSRLVNDQIPDQPVNACFYSLEGRAEGGAV